MPLVDGAQTGLKKKKKSVVMKRLVAAVLTALAVIAAALVLTTQAASAADPVTVGGQQHAVDGVDVYRSSNFLVTYTPVKGATTGTNAYGFEAKVVGGKVTEIADGVGNMAIPANGFVLSGHGTSRTWLKANAIVGATVTEGSLRRHRRHPRRAVGGPLRPRAASRCRVRPSARRPGRSTRTTPVGCPTS